MIVVAAVVAIIVATIVVASSTASAAIVASASASASTSASVATAVLVPPNSRLFAFGEDGGWELDALEQFGLVSVGGSEGRHLVVDPSDELVRWLL
jgi:hypothetical protein